MDETQTRCTCQSVTRTPPRCARKHIIPAWLRSLRLLYLLTLLTRQLRALKSALRCGLTCARVHVAHTAVSLTNGCARCIGSRINFVAGRRLALTFSFPSPHALAMSLRMNYQSLTGINVQRVSHFNFIIRILCVL